MPRTLPQPDPPRLRQFSAICRSTGSDPVAAQRALTPIWNSRYDRCVDQGRHLPTAARPNSRCYPQPREPVRGGAVWACRIDGAMDGAIEPPWVRALCLRSTASQAPERPAASGWAGPRSGVYGVCCKPTPPRQPTECSLLLLPASGRHYRGCRAAGPAEPLHSATCSTCRGSGLVSGSCQKIIVEVRVIAPTHRNVACSAAVALLLSR